MKLKMDVTYDLKHANSKKSTFQVEEELHRVTGYL